MHRLTYALLPALLVAAPAFAHVESAHFTGSLRDAPRVHQASVYFDEDGPSETPVEQMTREQLQNEYRRLDADRPGIGLAIGLTAGGGGALFVGVIYTLYFGFLSYLFTGIDSGVSSAGIVVAAVFIGIAIVGGVLLTVGLIKLFKTLGKRREYGARMDDINARLENMDRGAPPPVPGSAPLPPGYDANPPPPPPPPPPPGAMFQNVEPHMVLATF